MTTLVNGPKTALVVKEEVRENKTGQNKDNVDEYGGLRFKLDIPRFNRDNFKG